MLPGTEVTFAIEAGNIVISRLASRIKTPPRPVARCGRESLPKHEPGVQANARR